MTTTGTIHVMPVGDLIQHEAADDCVCGPKTQPIELDDGAIGWMQLHHMLDNRTAH